MVGLTYSSCNGQCVSWDFSAFLYTSWRRVKFLTLVLMPNFLNSSRSSAGEYVSTLTCSLEVPVSSWFSIVWMHFFFVRLWFSSQSQYSEFLLLYDLGVRWCLLRRSILFDTNKTSAGASHLFDLLRWILRQSSLFFSMPESI